MVDLDDVTSGTPVDPVNDHVHDDNFVLNELKRIFLQSRDNFDRQVANPLLDLIDVAGEKQFTPERLRYYKDGSPVFLQYGTDPTYSETDQGHRLQPGSGQTLTLRTAEKTAYQVGFDLWPTMSRVVNQAPQAGDVVAGGYGELDLANFDPDTISYTGTDADGYFWYHTAETGLDSMVIAMVDSGTVIDSETVSLEVGAGVFTILEQRLNWYAVGPALFRETYTDKTVDALSPQQNQTVGAVANDDGRGPANGSQRVSLGIHQASGNSGLELEAGSIAVRAPGPVSPQFKAKGHSMDLENTVGTEGTYQVCGAMRIAPTREESKLRITDLAIIKTPGSSVNRTRVLLVAVDPQNTDADTKTFESPVEHNSANSVLREVEDNTIVGPIEDDAGTDATGATTANTMTNPGGYQLARASVTPEGTGSKTSISEAEGAANRELYPGDIALILVDAETSGTTEVDIITEQNS